MWWNQPYSWIQQALRIVPGEQHHPAPQHHMPTWVWSKLIQGTSQKQKRQTCKGHGGSGKKKHNWVMWDGKHVPPKETGLMVVSFPGDFFFKGIFQENSHHSAIVETKLTKDWVLKPSICHRTNSRSWAWFRLNITIKWIQMVEDTVRRYCDSVIAGTLLQCLAGSSS